MGMLTIWLLGFGFLCMCYNVDGQVSLTATSAPTCGETVVLRCSFTGRFNPILLRGWDKGSKTIAASGFTISSKYSEDISNAAANYFELTISNFVASDADNYHCNYGFDTATVAITCTVEDIDEDFRVPS